jgi:hypothetical protein
MFAETLFAIEKMSNVLDATRPEDAKAIIDSEDGRKQLSLFCSKMKETVTYLCEMKLRPEKARQATKKATRTKRKTSKA